MLFMLRLAAASRRVLLLKWTKPLPLESFLVPNEVDGIDWRAEGTELPPSKELCCGPTPTILENPDGSRLDLQTTKLENSGWQNEKFVVFNTNMFAEAPLLDGPPADDVLTKHCMFQFLFKFSPEVERLANHWLQVLYKGVPPVVGAHLRLGNLQVCRNSW